MGFFSLMKQHFCSRAALEKHLGRKQLISTLSQATRGRVRVLQPVSATPARTCPRRVEMSPLPLSCWHCPARRGGRRNWDLFSALAVAPRLLNSQGSFPGAGTGDAGRSWFSALFWRLRPSSCHPACHCHLPRLGHCHLPRLGHAWPATLPGLASRAHPVPAGKFSGS